MKKTFVLLTTMVLFLSFSFKTPAQDDPPKYQYYLISDDIVYPSIQNQYEEGLKDYIAVFAKNNFPYPLHLFTTSDFHYYYAIPLDNFSDIDSIGKYINQAKKASSEKWEKAWNNLDGTFEYTVNKIIVQDFELTYIPENPRLTYEEAVYNYWVFTYVKQGHIKEYSEMAKKWKDLYQTKGIKDGYSVYWGGMGTEQPLCIWQMKAKTPADFWNQNKINNEAAGEESKKLWEEEKTLVRKVEYKEGWYRPKFSYIPNKE